MDKVVIVYGDEIDSNQDEILHRFIRFRMRNRRFSVINALLATEAQFTFKIIQQAAPNLVVFVIDPCQHLLVAEQWARVEADSNLDSVGGITIYSEDLVRVYREQLKDCVELRAPEEPIRHPPPEIPKRFQRTPDEILAEYCEQRIPRERCN